MTRPEANRILHVPRRFSVADWGGTETVVVNLCREQAAAGFRPEIHTSKALCPDSFSTYGECLPIHRYGYTYPYLGLSPEEKAQMDRKGGNVLSLSLFASLLKRSDVRIYHAHALKRLGGEVLT
ncbi:MAG: glycosyltransferase family 1 protein, partial [Verrucomicrobiota bacterium]